MHRPASLLDARTISSTLDSGHTESDYRTPTMIDNHAETPALRFCTHTPACPSADALDRDAAHVVSAHPEQGWSLLCNGVVVFEDFGEILPDRQIVAPHRPACRRWTPAHSAA